MTARHVVEKVFPARSGFVASVRSWVVDRCAEAGVEPDVGEVVRLLASEVVTNAVRHTSSRLVTVRLTVRTREVEVAVGDEDPAPPRPRPPDVGDLGGRGLMLVAAMAKSWGNRPTPRGKIVWFQVARN